MVIVHRLKGEEFVINANMIESIEANPDTVITLSNEKKYIVQEKPKDLIEAIVEFQRKVFHCPFHLGKNEEKN